MVSQLCAAFMVTGGALIVLGLTVIIAGFVVEAWKVFL